MTSSKIHKILFVCHGNICRSPMAEMIFKHMVKELGISDKFEIASAATSTEEIGNGIYPPAQRMLRMKGIPMDPDKTARQVRNSDYSYYDLIILMDHYNMRNIQRIIPEDPEGKIRMMLSRDVADPWYTGDFEATYRDIIVGCNNLLKLDILQ